MFAMRPVMLSTFRIEWLAQVATMHFLASILEGSVIAAFAALAVRISSRQSARTKFAIWFSALLLMAGLPCLNGFYIGTGSKLPAGALSRPAIILPVSVSYYLLAAWVILAALGLLRLAVSLRQMRDLRKHCSPIDVGELDPGLREALENNRGSRRVALWSSRQVRVPTAIGLFAPAILIPDWVLKELSPEELRQIVLHELAHLRRWDDWTNLAQKIVKALFFFHPAIWWIERKLALQREMACDDAVLEQTAAPWAYAACLTRLAEKTLAQRTLMLAQAALGRVCHTSMRVANILDPARPHGTKCFWKSAAPLAVALVVCAALGWKEPQVIAFRSDQGKASASAIPATPSALPTADVPAVKIQPAAFKFAQRAGREADSPARIHPAVAGSKIVRHHSPRLLAVETTLVMTGPFAQSSLGGASEFNADFISASSLPAPAIFLFVTAPVDNATGLPIFQICIWHLTVIHPIHPATESEIHSRKT